jgi:hypothetical protein
MSISLLVFLGALAGATVALTENNETNADTVVGIHRGTHSSTVEHDSSRTALASPAPVYTSPLSKPYTSSMPKADLAQPLQYIHVKPMTGETSPAIFQTPQDGVDADGNPRRMALVNIGGGLGILCREIESQHRNHQLVQLNGDRVVMRVNPPADTEVHLDARCREAIALMPIGS